ncbi:hypothetical protein ACQEVF_43245 [Nonomuraea polychroma]|uniref:hypothetical protein n=1 Tax=Nonomuraea polychroma TaxID=46176 RepID=UPI003D91F30B
MTRHSGSDSSPFGGRVAEGAAAGSLRACRTEPGAAVVDATAAAPAELSAGGGAGRRPGRRCCSGDEVAPALPSGLASDPGGLAELGEAGKPELAGLVGGLVGQVVGHLL